MRKILRKDKSVAEVEDTYKLLDGEEEAPEEEEEKKDEEKFQRIMGPKIDELIKAIKDTPQRKVINTKDTDLEYSEMETDTYKRRKKPFVKLSKGMTEFVADMKTLARGGMPQSLQKALAEGTDTTGGYLVPEEFQAEVIRYTEEVAVIRPRARVFPMVRDKMGWPKLDQSSDSFAGVTMYWPGESELKTASNPTFGKVMLDVKKVIGLCPVPDELLADSAINLANFLVTLFGEAIAYEEDKQFIQGTGVGKPLGIIKTTGITRVSRSASSKIGVADVTAMYQNLPAWADGNAIWLTSKAGLGQLMSMDANATNKLLLWMPNLREGAPATLLGKPIVLTEKVDTTIGNVGDIILCNLDYYYIGDRGALEVSSSIHDRFRYDETTFRFVKRVDGQPSIAKAFVVLNK